MFKLLEFIFSSFWIFLGVLILLALVGEVLVQSLRSIFKIKEKD